MEKWLVFSKKADFDQIGKDYGISPIIARIIRNRDVEGKPALDTYLKGKLNRMHSPWKLKGMESAVKILRSKIKLSRKIRVFSDYDIDGICGAYILVTALEELGAIVDLRIPDRVTDGYGMNSKMVEEAARDSVDTIITCDNGIAAAEAVERARELGMTVIVTDHHEVPYEDKWGKREYHLPEADVVIDPKQPECEYPYKEICGAVVAYKYMEALYERMGMDSRVILKYLQYAAFATVGDVVELLGENRIIVQQGLQFMNRTPNLGLRKLIELNELQDKTITSYHIGFVLGPCLNAAGRIKTAKMAFELLRTTDEKEALRLARHLKDLNEYRKKMTAEGVKLAMEDAKSFPAHPVLVIYVPGVHESVAGIIAGRIRDYYYKPTIILTGSEQGVKGSGRSIEGYHMFEELSKCKHLLTRFGGHAMAAGMSLEEENVDLLRNTLNRNCRLSAEDLIQKIWIDVAMPFEYASVGLVEQLKVLEPFGKGNERPVFAEKNVSILNLKVVGEKGNVIRMKMANSSGCIMQGVCFEEGEKMLSYLREKFGSEDVEKALAGMPNRIRLNVIYYPRINTYRGYQDVEVTIERYM